MKTLTRAAAALGVGLVSLGMPATANADPGPGTGHSDAPYSLGDCGDATLVHVNHRSPVIHDPDTTTVWIFKEVTYSDGVTTETVRLGEGIDDQRLVTCVDRYVDDGTTITYTARLLPAGPGQAR